MRTDESQVLADALANFQGEHPADVYTEDGYRVWLSSTVVKVCARKTAALLNARVAFDDLYDGVPGLDDPTTLARIRNFLEATPGTGYTHHPVLGDKEPSEQEVRNER